MTDLSDVTDDAAASGAQPLPTVLVVDAANVVGSIPDGWWRDRAGAAQRLLAALGPVPGRTVAGPDEDAIRVVRVIAVLEGQANRADESGAGTEAGESAVPSARPEIVRATGSGDDAIMELVTDLVAADEKVLVVTADRGLRARLPGAAAVAGPTWLNRLLGRGRTPR